MFRDSSAAGAIYVAIQATPGSGVTMQWRSTTGGSTSAVTTGGVAGPTASNPVWLKLVGSNGTYTGYYSLNGSTWNEVGATSLTFTNAAYLAGLGVTSHDNGTSCTATFDNVSVATTLPSGWTDADIGGPSPAGSVNLTAGVYTISGGGTNITGTSDEFNFASETVSGDQTMIARATSETNTNVWAKAGPMFRDSSAAGAIYVAIQATPASGVTMQWRSTTNGATTAATTGGIAGPSASNPVWLKLVKSGSLYTGYYSLNGSTWTEVGSTSLNFTNSSYLAGLGVTSHDNGTSCTATFDNVSVTAAAGGALPAGWADADIGATTPAGSATFVPSPSGGGIGGEGSGVYTLSGGGADIFNAADQFNFASQPASGDQTLVARVTAQTGANAWSKAGVMFRDMLPSTAGGGAGGEGTSAGAMFVDMIASPGEGVSIQWRSSTGGQCALYNVTSVAAPTASNPVWVMLVKNGSLYTGYYSLDGNTWTDVGSISVNFSNVNYLAGLAVTSHSSGVLSTATFDNVSLAPSLPLGWTSAGIGSPSPVGSASFLPYPSGGGAGGGGVAGESGVYTVSGEGSDIWNSADQFEYAWQTTSGDQTLVARVTSQTDTAAWAKAGVMFRDSSAAGAMFVDMVATPGSGVSLQWRDATSGGCGAATISSVAAPSGSQPVWVKLVKSGTTYTGYYSLDGLTWLEVGSTSVTFSNTDYLAGLAVDSDVSGVLGTATFDNVSLSPSVSDDLALNAPVTVSSTDSNGDVGANAVDGNPGTNWTSASGGTQWIEVDLGSTCSVNEVQLDWGAAFAGAYSIQVSPDGNSWATIYGTTTGVGGVQDLAGLDASGRYVRLLITAGPSASYTLNQFAVYPVTLTWAGGNGAWGPGCSDWIGPNGQLQTWQNGAAVVFGPVGAPAGAGVGVPVGVPPSGGSGVSPSVICIFGQVSPSSITFTTGAYVLQAGADPLGDQIVLPLGGAVVNVQGSSTIATMNAIVSGGSANAVLTLTGAG